MKLVPLGAVCSFDRQQDNHESLPYVGMEHIESGTGRFLGSTEPQEVKSTTFRFSSEHVLYGKLRPYLNKVLLPDFEGHCSTEIVPLRPTGAVSREFLFYWLTSDSTVSRINATCTGARMPRANMDAVLEMELPVPTLPEQRRIVAILDQAFESIATAKANAEQSLQNARAVFESALDAALSHHDSGYVETRLGDEIDLLAGYAFPSKNYTTAADGIKLLRGDNIMQGYLRWDDAKLWPIADATSVQRFALQNEDVVLAMDRPWVKAGLKRAQIGLEDLPCLQVQRTARLRAGPRLNAGFLYHLTGSRVFSRHLLNAQTGVGVPHISGKQIESFTFMLPPLNDQERIARALDDLLQQSSRLEEIFNRKLAALAELRQSLLHQAFSGGL